ncbi:MAG: alanyl-tRNA editing protein [Puniceicoccales bacterium]|jgi:alanyl-tRNA synthetase|nr:alanyl-tRNA editing protein [Puniceicoccales bacterium]
MTFCLFAENSYLFDTHAKIIAQGSDEKGTYLVLDQTVFYPQGGGQPSDIGTIECRDLSFDVIGVRKDGDAVRHYVGNQYTDNLEGADCLCTLDVAARILNMRYHSAGHLLSNIAESICREMIAVKAHCFPNEAYVEFQGPGICDQESIAKVMEDAIGAGLPISVFKIAGGDFEAKFYKLPYPVPPREEFRVVQIGTHKPIPCGGTHLASTGEIGNFEITKIKNKNGNLRISFAVV